MGDLLKDAYAEEVKKRDYKTKFGNLLYEYAIVSQSYELYRQQLVAIDEKIKKLVDEVAHENS